MDELLNRQNPIENALIGLWMTVLRSQEVGETTSVLDSGCSEAVLRDLQGMVESIFEVSLPEDCLVRNPTPRRMAAVIAEERRHQGGSVPPIERVPRDRPIPLSHSQERMWFVHQIEKNSTAYNVGGAAEVRGRLDREALQEGLNAVARRHEALRTVFPVVDGQPVQQVCPYEERPIEWLDVSSLPEERREAEGLRLAEECTRIPFDLERGPLFFFRVIRLAGDRHIFAMNLHHIVVDAWGFSVFASELAEVYNARVQGREARLPELAFHYADYAAWQRAYLAGERLDRQLDYWQEQLRGLSPAELPSIQPRPAAQTYGGSVVNQPIASELMDDLARFCQGENVTPFMVFLAAFYLLLFRYSGQEDLTLAVPIANRNWSAAHGMIGTLVNTLLMRVRLEATMTFRQLLQAVRKTALEAFDHQDVPYALLVSRLQPERDASRTPFAQLMFNMVNMPLEWPRLEGLELAFLDTDRQGVQFDVTFNIHHNALERRISLEYNTRLFNRAGMERLIGHYNGLLQGAMLSPDLPVARLGLLTEAEQRQLAAWNDTRSAFPENATITRLFEEQAARAPGSPAFFEGETAISYAELNRRANQAAAYLAQKGVTPGTVVGLCARRSIDAVVALLGILKAGGAYLPLDPAYPRQRLEYMLRDSGAQVVVGLSGDLEPLALSGVKTVIIDREASQIEAFSGQSSPERLLPGSPLYVLYTSGSTGQPKGVVGSHRAALNRFAWMWRAYPFAPGEITCQKTALSFVDSVWELFGPLLAGVPAVIIPDEISRDPRLLLDALAARRVTRIVLVPSLLKALLMLDPRLGRSLPSLSLWVSSGEALPADLTGQFALAHPGARLLNLYGSSEVAGDVTCFDTREEAGSFPSVPIGRPLDNTSMYVLDADLHPLPVEIPGEIYAGGANLAIGYHNRPELTARAFIPDPFSGEPGARLFRTGDVGCFLPGGSLLYLGRRDHQVKVRGMRVELDEIEQAIREQDGVAECVVVTFDHEPAGLSIAAYMVARAGAALSEAALRAALRERLPGYMIPDDFVFLDQMPLTPNGKLDRKALPAPDQTRRAAALPFAAPADPVEQQVSAIWQDVLGVRSAGRDDHFFEQGGHSLLAVLLLARIQSGLGVKIPLAQFLQLPTVAGITRMIRAGDEGVEWQALVPIKPQGSRAPLFLAHGFGGGVTEYADLASQLGPDQPVYGLQSVGLDGRTPPYDSLSEIAAGYLRNIRAELQPSGPYYLGGYCFGGLVAYEMARQLRAAGEQVAFLALIETYPPRRLMEKPWRLLAPRSAAQFLKNAAAWIPGERARRRRRGDKLRRWASETPIFDRSAEARFLSGEDVDLATLIYPGFKRVSAAHLRALQTCVLGPYDGPVDIYHVAVFRLLSPLDNDLGWKRLARGDIRVHKITGWHDNLLEPPFVEDLAAQMSAALSAAQNQGA